jgi:anti-sigma B factor antagonist
VLRLAYVYVLDFRVASSRMGRTAVVAISGELDMHTAERVEAKLREAVADDGCCIVVDLLETSFIDSVGIGLLAAAARRVRSTGGTFVLAADDAQFLRTLRITGLDRLFYIEPTLTDAVERVVERSPALV